MDNLSKFVKFILYDPRIEGHRSYPRDRRHEYDDRIFFQIDLPVAEESKVEAHFAQHNRYPIGITPRVTRPGAFGPVDATFIGDAYFPRVGETTLSQDDIKWLAKADTVKLFVDYDEAINCEWDKPKLYAGMLKPVPKFNPDWLPVSVQPWIIDVSERMSVPLDFAAVGAMVTLAGAVGARAKVYPKEFDKKWCEVITLSGAVIASSGKKKTPTWGALMKPLYELEGEWRRQYEASEEAYETALAAWGENKKLIDAENKEEMKAAKKEKRPVNLKFVPPAPVPPAPLRRLVVNDTTPEQMHEIAKANKQGLLFYRDELSGWAAELEMDGRQSMRGFFLDGMTGDHEHTVDRIGRDGGSATLTFNIFGSFQPVMFINFLSEVKNVGSGMLPRFHLIVWPEDEFLPHEDRKHNEQAETVYRHVVRTLAKMEYDQVELHFDEEAQRVFNTFDAKLEEYIKAETNEGKKSHLSKYSGSLPKLAALFQLIDLVGTLPVAKPVRAVTLNQGEENPVIGESEVQIPSSISVDVTHLRKAADVFTYLIAHMHRVYDSKQSGTQYRMARLIDHLKNGDLNDGFTARDILRKDWAGLGQKSTTADALEDSLEGLQRLGWVRAIPPRPGTMGRPVTKWNINPLIEAGDFDTVEPTMMEDEEVEDGKAA